MMLGWSLTSVVRPVRLERRVLHSNLAQTKGLEQEYTMIQQPGLTWTHSGVHRAEVDIPAKHRQTGTQLAQVQMTRDKKPRCVKSISCKMCLSMW